MKAVKAYTEHWEEINFLRLLQIAKLVNDKLNYYLKILLVICEVSLYISYLALKGLYLIIKLMFLTEPALKQAERDENWIFRQIK
jgi:hypothetical protein